MTGFINVNKRKGDSSAREVGRIKRILKIPCGHMGTLDPMASGVLPVAIGNAARLFDYFLNKEKVYEAEFTFGTDSDTLDTTGNLIENAGRIPSEKEIESVLPDFTGEIMQTPPKYSAKSVNGKRGYQLARAGVEFKLEPKKVKINSLKLLGERKKGVFGFEISCGGGTYIRSLARDIANSLGTYAVMSALTRTQSGVFRIENSVETETLTADNVENYIIPTDSVINFESVFADETDSKKLTDGLKIFCGRADGLYKLFLADGSFYGLGEVKDSFLKARTKLC